MITKFKNYLEHTQNSKKQWAMLSFILLGVVSTIWFLVRVVPKPSRASYPCMQAASPIMSSFVVWLLAILGSAFAFKKAKQKLFEAKYVAAGLFVVLGIVAVNMYTTNTNANPDSPLKIWYKANEPVGVAKGIFPGRVAWGHNPKIASWDGITGSWWDDKWNNQAESDKLFTQTMTTLTGSKSDKEAWKALFHSFNKTKKKTDVGYKAGEKIAIKVNLNNTSSHASSNDINAGPQIILSMLKSLINEGGVPQENITLADPSRFFTDNIYNKCHAIFPNVHYADHDGGDGREKSEFIKNAIPYSVDNGKVATGLATSFVNADYIINMATLKGHVSQGVTLCAKNFFGCTDIETDWSKNSHSGGFSQKQDGSHTYSVYPDYLGYKDLGAKTVLYLIDDLYSNKLLYNTPSFKWKMAPFNNNWPNSLFASQDPVALESVALDFVLAEWPDAPDLMYSDYYLNESALADNPPSKTVYDPERDGSKLTSLGTAEHWNNPTDKKYSRNLDKTGKGIELVYSLVK